MALLVAACSSDEGGSGSSPPADPDIRPATTLATTATTATGTATPVQSVENLDDAAVGYETVATFEDTPMAMAIRPGDEDEGVAYVALRSGSLARIHLFGDPSSTVQDTVLDFSDDTTTDSERGFLGLAFSPDGSHLYTSYTDSSGDTRIDEYEVDGGKGDHAIIDLGSRRQVLALDQPYSNHNGGNIAFGPDGYLYIGLGDGGAAGDPENRAQNPSELLGKVLRIDPAPGHGSPYGVPDDNPFAGGEATTGVAGARPEIWISGVRNPWRWSFDSATGDLWIGDVGQNEVEEIDFLPKAGPGTWAGRGANLGWNLLEGDQPYLSADSQPPPAYVGPVFTYDHADGGCAIIGGYVYRGTELPDLEGAYVYSDSCEGHLDAVLVDGSRTVVDQADLGALPDAGGPVSLGQDAAGELYVLFGGGQLARITAD